MTKLNKVETMICNAMGELLKQPVEYIFVLFPSP